MQLEYKQLNETIKLREKLITVIEEEINKNKTFRTKVVAEKMNRSITWVNNAIKQLNTEDVCINGFEIKYKDLRNRGVYSKIIKMIEDTETIFPLFVLKNKEICLAYNVTNSTVYMYREFLRENLESIKQFWIKHEDFLKYFADEVKDTLDNVTKYMYNGNKRGGDMMNMQETARLILGLRAAGWSEKEINDFMLFIESGEEKYKPKANDKKSASDK